MEAPEEIEKSSKASSVLEYNQEYEDYLNKIGVLEKKQQLTEANVTSKQTVKFEIEKEEIKTSELLKKFKEFINSENFDDQIEVMNPNSNKEQIDDDAIQELKKKDIPGQEHFIQNKQIQDRYFEALGTEKEQTQNGSIVLIETIDDARQENKILSNENNMIKNEGEVILISYSAESDDESSIQRLVQNQFKKKLEENMTDQQVCNQILSEKKNENINVNEVHSISTSNQNIQEVKESANLDSNKVTDKGKYLANTLKIQNNEKSSNNIPQVEEEKIDLGENQQNQAVNDKKDDVELLTFDKTEQFEVKIQKIENDNTLRQQDISIFCNPVNSINIEEEFINQSNPQQKSLSQFQSELQQEKKINNPFINELHLDENQEQINQQQLSYDKDYEEYQLNNFNTRLQNYRLNILRKRKRFLLRRFHINYKLKCKKKENSLKKSQGQQEIQNNLQSKIEDNPEDLKNPLLKLFLTLINGTIQEKQQTRQKYKQYNFQINVDELRKQRKSKVEKDFKKKLRKTRKILKLVNKQMKMISKQTMS